MFSIPIDLGFEHRQKEHKKHCKDLLTSCASAQRASFSHLHLQIFQQTNNQKSYTYIYVCRERERA